MFVRPNGSVTGSIFYAGLPTESPKKGPGRPRKAAAEPAAANPDPQPQPEPEPQPEKTP